MRIDSVNVSRPTAPPTAPQAPVRQGPVPTVADAANVDTIEVIPLRRPAGVRDGAGIDNAHTILSELWKSLGHDEEPKVAVIFVEPFADKRFSFFGKRHGSTNNPFGHAAVAYRVDGKLSVMNIVGCAKPKMVNHFSLERYLFDPKALDEGAEQGGIYDRTFRIFAMWDVEDAKIEKLTRFYEQLDADATAGKATYNMNFSRVLNWVRKICRWLPRYGNCATYSADGLHAAGLVDGTSMWPKQVFVNAWRRNRDRRRNTKLVTFERAPDAPQRYGQGSMRRSMISPHIWDWIPSLFTRDLTAQSDAVVSVPRGANSAQIRVSRPERFNQGPNA